MKFKYNAKYTTIAIYSIIVFVICMLLVFIFFRASAFMPYIKKIFNVCAPIFTGIAIAYLLNPIAEFFYRILGKAKIKNKTLIKVLGILITFTIVLSLLTVLIISLVPELLNSIKKLFNNIPQYYNLIIKTVERLSEKYPEISKEIISRLNGAQPGLSLKVDNLEKLFNNLFSDNGVLKNVTGGAINVLNVLKNILLGLIVAVYLLYNKNHFIAGMKKIVFALFNHKHASNIINMSSKANVIFSNFIIGKAIDSIIIGILCFIGTSILNLPYTILVSVIVGFTNMIPFFGPFIGAIPSAFLILLSGGLKQAIIFTIFIIILQQLDGNVIGPMILGNKLGISAFWIMCSVIIGGGLFGFIGMIIAVPIFTIIHDIVSEAVSERLVKKGLPIGNSDYLHNK